MTTSTKSSTDTKQITRRDITKSWFMWWLLAETNHSFERMQGFRLGSPFRQSCEKFTKILMI